MAKKGIKRGVGGSSCSLSITPHKESSKDAICEICDRVFATDNNVYICLECREKAKNIRH